jgi:hypothetical protein
VRRIWIPLLVGLLSLSGAAVAADALVVTEQEELEGFVEDVTAAKSEVRLDGALSNANLSAVPCRVQQGGRVQAFGEGESAELAESLRGALSVFDSEKQSLLQQSIDVDGDHATVTARVGDESYEQTVIYELKRTDKRWLVRSIRVL